MKKLAAALGALVLVASACSGDSADTTQPEGTTAGPETTQATGTTTDGGPATSPSSIVFEAQESDGASIVVASVSLPSQGFIAVHSNADGGPGPVIGHSDLLPAGDSTDVEITLDEPLTTTDMVFPMVHIDINGNGEYEFFPPDNVIDVPGTTADDAVAVVGAEVMVTG